MTPDTVVAMSRRLVLVRHAQAAPNDPRGDHERVLAGQGAADATELGRWLAEHGLVPDHVLVSTARRAQQTLTALREGLGAHTLREDQVWSERRLYAGETDGVLAAVQEVPEQARVVWVVGHEPVMSSTAWELADPGAGSETLLGQLRGGLPTATAVVLQVAGEWAEVRRGEARAVALWTGRSLTP